MTDIQAKIIRDTPAEQDAFFGAGHNRSAQTVARAILDLEESSENDCAIGLEGGWGAGKSTVVRLTEKELQKARPGKAERFFFTFDLWAHQPELLKLAFLEELLAWSHSKGFLDDDQLKLYSKKLADREITTTIENFRELAWPGIAFVLAAPLLPILYSWLGPVHKDEFALLFGISASQAAQWLFGSIYVIFAIIAAVGFWKLRKNTGKHKIKSALAAAAQIFSKESDFEEMTQHIKERNPTSEQFQETFRTIVSIIQKDGGRKIVFVFDNLDRLPQNTLARVWSEVRSIFAMPNRGIRIENSQITAIVAYDIKSIASAFSDNGGSDSTETVDHFVRKTFDLTIRVAPPISTDWKMFLESKLDEAFSNTLSATEKYELFRHLDIQYKELNDHPSPRAIIAYVNEIGAVWNSRKSEVPLAHIALYVLNRRTLEQDASSLTNGSFISERKKGTLGTSDWLKSLAALHFNVPREHAYQVLLGGEIETVAIKESPSEFLETSKKHGFSEVFPDLVQTRIGDWARETPELVANLAQNVASLESSATYLEETWRHIRSSVRFFSNCDVSQPTKYVQLARLIEHVDPADAKSTARQLTDWYTTHIPSSEPLKIESGENWSDFYSEIHRALTKATNSQQAEQFQAELRIPNDARFVIGLYAANSSGEAFDPALFVVNELPNAELESHVLELVDSAPSKLLNVIYAEPDFLKDTFWPQLVEKTCTAFRNEKINTAARESLSKSLLFVRQKTIKLRQNLAPFSSLAADGSLIWHTARAIESEHFATATNLLWLYLEFSDGKFPPPNPGTHPLFGNLSGDFETFTSFTSDLDKHPDVLKGLAKHTIDSGRFENVVSWASNASGEKLFVALIKAIVDHGRVGNTNLTLLVKNYNKVLSIVGVERQNALLGCIARFKPAFEKSFGGENCLQIPEELSSDIAKLKSDGLENLNQQIDDYFSGFSREDWSELLLGENEEALPLLLSRIEHGNFKPPSDPYSTVLHDHVMSILDSTVSISAEQKRWHLLIRGLQDFDSAKFARDIVLSLNSITTTPTSIGHFVDLFPELAMTLPYQSKPAEAIEQFLIPLMNLRSETTFSFFDRIKPNLSSIYEEAPEQTQKSFVDALFVNMRSDENAKLRLEPIASHMGIRVVESTDEN